MSIEHEMPGFFLATVEIKNYNVKRLMENTFLIKRYEMIQKKYDRIALKKL